MAVILLTKIQDHLDEKMLCLVEFLLDIILLDLIDN